MYFCLSYWFGLVWFVVVILGVLFDRTGFGLVWFGSVCFCNMGVLFDRTGFGLVWFVLVRLWL